MMCPPGRLRHNLHEAAEASTTQQLLNDSEDERSLLKRLEHQISLLEELTTQALLEKEALLEERKRALAVLGAKDATGRKLDIEVYTCHYTCRRTRKQCVEIK